MAFLWTGHLVVDLQIFNDHGITRTTAREDYELTFALGRRGLLAVKPEERITRVVVESLFTGSIIGAGGVCGARARSL